MVISFLLSLVLFFLALTVHEYAHGWIAYKFGDPTAKYHGRLTFNPISHIDPAGTVVLPVFLILTGSPVVFGWAKPVPVNFSLLKNPKRDMLWVGLAGPTANFIFAFILSFVLKIALLFYGKPQAALITQVVMINLILGVFNLMPVPPLDGWRVLLSLLPYNMAASLVRLEPFGMFIVFFLLWLGVMHKIIWPIVLIMAKLLGVAL